MIFQVIGPSSFYLAFVFLMQSATASETNDPFGGYGDDVLSVCSSLYIATLGVTVICALGNKPAASRWWYMFVVVVFAALFCIEFYCAGYTIWLAVPKTVAGWEDVDALMANSVFVDIVISLGATYGLYLFGSILYLEPWHMLTSFSKQPIHLPLSACLLIKCIFVWTVQYMLMLPAFANVLPIYSFSNLHDLAWGTKGDTSVKNLGGAKKAGDGKDEVEVKIPTAPEDVDALWLEMKKDVGTPFVAKHVKRDVHTKQADHVRPSVPSDTTRICLLTDFGSVSHCSTPTCAPTRSCATSA
jgi:chitin synthase